MNLSNRRQNRFYAHLTLHLPTTLFFTLTVAVLLARSGTANATPLGEISAHFATERSEDTGASASSERHFRVHLATGWSHDVAPENKIGYGISFRTERGLQSGSDLAGYGVAAFVGWYDGPFSMRVDYIALAELKSNNGVAETAFREGTGFSVQARWIHWFGDDVSNERTRRMGFGPSLAFEQITYAKSRVGSLPETSNARVTEALMPGFTGVFYF